MGRKSENVSILVLCSSFLDITWIWLGVNKTMRVKFYSTLYSNWWFVFLRQFPLFNLNAIYFKMLQLLHFTLFLLVVQFWEGNINQWLDRLIYTF